jgi:hypothetical protein
MDQNAEAAVTQNQLSGRATGALFFSVFGALWIGLGLYVRETLTAVYVVPTAILLTALIAGALWLKRRAASFPHAPADKAQSRSFNRINLAQWVAIGLVGVTFGRLHIELYALTAIVVIVGLHLLPLARVFHYPMHYVTGTALLAWAVLTLCFVSHDHLQSVTAIGTGIVLWLSAAVTLALAWVLARRRIVG